MGIFDKTRELAGAWADAKIRNLQGTPDTRIDSGGSVHSYQFDGQEITRDELREIKHIRESGGVIAMLMRAKALMNFGTGVEWVVENNDESAVSIDGETWTLREWLEDTFNDLDETVLDIGEDALWYPYGAAEIVETRGGAFSHVEPVEPWTILPVTDDKGNIIAWEQEIQGDRGATVETFDASDIIHFPINKASARDKTGISAILRSEEEIANFRENQQAIQSAIELHGFPQRHVKVGSEGSAPIRDNELRRIRNLFDSRTVDSDTVFVTGQDVDIEALEAENFDFGAVTENDMRLLSLALGMPLEFTNFGKDGLGSGAPAELRMTLFKLQVVANQRAYTNIWVRDVIRPILRDYTPFDHTRNLEMNLEDPMTGKDEMAELLSKVGDYYETNEAREALDLEPKDDLEGEYGPPGDNGDDEGMGGLFQESVANELDKRELQDIEDMQEDIPEDFDECVDYVVSESDMDEESAEYVCGHMRDPDKTGTIENAAGGTDFSQLPEWEAHLMEIHQQTWETDDTRLLDLPSDTVTPEFVKDRIRDAINSGAVFSDIETLTEGTIMDLRGFLKDELTDDGWTITGLTDELTEYDDTLSRSEAETIARTETASIANTAREQGYEEKGLVEDSKFYWSGSLDDRTTDACRWLIEKTNPFHGGTPVPLEELRELVEEAPTHDDELPDDIARPENWVVHYNERKTYTRAVE